MAQVTRVTLAGLIEGQVPGHAGLAERLRRANEHLLARGFDFALEVDLPTFSLLPRSSEAFEWSQGDVDPETSLREALNHFLGEIPSTHRPLVFSTLRGIFESESRKSQAVFAVGPDGTITTESRQTPAPPMLPSVPFWRRSLPILMLYVLMGALTFWFVSERGQWSAEKLGLDRYPAPQTLVVDAGPLAGHLRVVVRQIDAQGVHLELERPAGFPTRWDTYDAMRKSMMERGESAGILALDAVFKGTITARFRTSDGEFSPVIPLRFAPAFEKESDAIVCPLPDLRSIGALHLNW